MQGTIINEKQHTGKALASMILGIVSLITWLIPLFGAPTSIIGLILGIIGRKSQSKGKATVGIVLSSIALIVNIINGVLAA
jgi:uncharacterized membrane protein